MDFVSPQHPDYDHIRLLHNGSIDKRPALIARCRSLADIANVVKRARDEAQPLAIRGGGHNVAGLASVDAGIMLDLSLMKGVHVDPVARTVRVEGGCLWREVNAATAAHALATTGGVVSSTGVAGLTLGGGLGWLMGRYGLALDNLVSAVVVTADGRAVTASETEHPDLFWALRGAGANFGVVGSFQFALHDVGPVVAGGLIAYPLTAARDVLRWFRDFTASAPDHVTLAAALTHAPDGSGVPLAAILMCDCGALEEGLAYAARLKAVGTPAMDGLGPIPYTELNQMLDSGFPRGARNYWKSRFVKELTDEAIDGMVDLFGQCPSIASVMVLEHIHGEAARKAIDATAFAHRREGYSFVTMAQWQDPACDGPNVAWAKASLARVQPALEAGAYVNYLDADEGSDPVAAAYGTNYARLRALKRRYDPDNLFRINHNIPPA
ncbi:MAG: FAD-binding oxidoreductase [Vicinamibacterales bacterium]